VKLSPMREHRAFLCAENYFQKIGEIDITRLYSCGVIDDITDMRDAFSDSQQPAK